LSNDLEYSAEKFGRASIKIKIVSEKPKNEEDFTKMLQSILYNLGNNCLRKTGAVIGHIKAYLKAGTGFLKASLVSLKSGVDIEGDLVYPVKHAELAIAAIVFGLEDKEVNYHLDNLIKRMKEQFDVEVEREPRHHAHHKEVPADFM